jgi:prefoldin subunit 5
MLKPVRKNVSAETLKYNIFICQKEIDDARQIVKDAYKEIRKTIKETEKIITKQRHYKELLKQCNNHR